MSVRIYTTGFCGYCARAKALLDERGIPYEEIDVTSDPETRRRLAEETGRRTVPQIFRDERPIGGYEELRELDLSGSLAEWTRS